MKSLCGADCANCQWNSTCPGCDHEKCFIARYIKKDGKEAYEEFKQSLIDEFNALGIPGMPKINELYAWWAISSIWSILSTADKK